jgi:bis(5'-nucleosyl)-tetraphosphatase (symmetrical)
MRRIFIGDVQGCLEQMESLLGAVAYGPGDHLYCVGDLVNRGPDSLGVLRRARALDAHAVLGNHDLKLLRIAAGAASPSRGDRLQAIFAAPDRDRLLDWLAAQPVLRVEPDVVVVHGGLDPTWADLPRVAADVNASVGAHVRGRSDPRIEFATEVRYCDASGRRPPEDVPPPGPPFAPWDRFYRGPRTVVFAHWARRGLVVLPRLRGLDTGCVYGGALTAWIAEEDRIVQIGGWQGNREKGLRC